MNILNIKGLIVGGAAVAFLALSTGCAKETTVDSDKVNEQFVEAWVNVNYPGTKATDTGIYIIDDQPGTGEAIGEDDYFVFVEYTVTDFDGTISSTTSETLSQQLGTYAKGSYYGPDIFLQDSYYTEVGVLDMLSGMRLGGTRTAIIPSWLNSTDATTANSTTPINAIYKISVVDKTDDIAAWQVDTLERYVTRYMDSIDSTMYGYYSKTLVEPTSSETFSTDTMYCINYTGRLLNGMVFDTNVEDTAKVYGIYSSSKTYSPMYVTPASEDDYTSTSISSSSTEEGSTVVDGFAYALSKIRPFEKIRCAFYSRYGYGYSGSSPSVPKYAPLVYDIEVVEDPNPTE